MDDVTTVIPVKMFYELSDEEEMEDIHYEFNLSNLIIISNPSNTVEFAVHNLRKELPDNIVLTCCQSCRHGNFCPFGDLDNEIFCLKGMNYYDKSDVVNIFLGDQNIRDQRKRELLDVCIDYECITDNFYTYNDWHSYN